MRDTWHGAFTAHHPRGAQKPRMDARHIQHHAKTNSREARASDRWLGPVSQPNGSCLYSTPWCRGSAHFQQSILQTHRLSSQEGLRGFEFGWRDAPCPWHALGHAARAAGSPGGLGGLGARRLGLWRRRTGRLHPDSRSRNAMVKRNALFTSPRWSLSCHCGAPYLCCGRANLRGHSSHRFLRVLVPPASSANLKFHRALLAKRNN